MHVPDPNQTQIGTILTVDRMANICSLYRMQSSVAACLGSLALRMSAMRSGARLQDQRHGVQQHVGARDAGAQQRAQRGAPLAVGPRVRHNHPEALAMLRSHTLAEAPSLCAMATWQSARRDLSVMSAVLTHVQVADGEAASYTGSWAAYGQKRRQGAAL